MKHIMNFLYWQDIDNNLFNIFIRDLSENLNSNIKNIIEDSLKDIKENKNKNKKLKKKDIIIRKQTEKRNSKLYEDDLKKISLSS